jgi:hypothetical protein
MNKHSVYAGNRIILTTKHGKLLAIAPPFSEYLAATVVEYPFDTDILGTFSGEQKRKGSALDCVKEKCRLGMHFTDSDYGLASEGSFGPHPAFPFIPCDHEILYFIDRKRDFHLSLSTTSEKTNYAMQLLDSLAELQAFANKVLFPSHALIMRPNGPENKNHIYKGINTPDELEVAFKETLKYAETGKVWVETDMRAHLNPSRMQVIQKLAAELAERLAVLCPNCENPGWGKVKVEPGLECRECGFATALIKSEIHGCCKCQHQEKRELAHHLLRADPKYCEYCNP